jgi:hypothetical protein
MERWIPVGLGSLALLVSLFNWWTLKGVDARLDALERAPRPPPVAVAQAQPNPAAARAALAAKLQQAPPEKREAARERLVELTTDLQAKRADKAEQARAELTAEVEAFAMDEGLDSETVGLILGLLEARSDAFHTVREDVRSGALNLADARRELEAEKEATDAELRVILGDDLFQVFDERMWRDRERQR